MGDHLPALESPIESIGDQSFGGRPPRNDVAQFGSLRAIAKQSRSQLTECRGEVHSPQGQTHGSAPTDGRFMYGTQVEPLLKGGRFGSFEIV